MITALVLATAIKCAYLVEVLPEDRRPYSICAADVNYDPARDILTVEVINSDRTTTKVEIDDTVIVYSGNAE